MEVAIAWGTPYYTGGVPETGPFVAGNSGVTNEAFTDGYAAMGLTKDPGYAVVSVVHSFAPANGSPEYTVDTYYPTFGYGAINPTVYISQYSPGIHTFVASIAYDTLPTKLVLAVTSGGGDYGTASWYEEAAALPVFWTRFINSKEVIE